MRNPLENLWRGEYAARQQERVNNEGDADAIRRSAIRDTLGLALGEQMAATIPEWNRWAAFTDDEDKFVLNMHEAWVLSDYLQRRMLDEDLAAHEPACELARQLYQWTKTHFETRPADRWTAFTDDELAALRACIGSALHNGEMREGRVLPLHDEMTAELERRKA